jgi:hypothetical protein
MRGVIEGASGMILPGWSTARAAAITGRIRLLAYTLED